MTIRDDIVEAAALVAWKCRSLNWPEVRRQAEHALAPFLPDDDGCPPWMEPEGARTREDEFIPLFRMKPSLDDDPR